MVLYSDDTTLYGIGFDKTNIIENNLQHAWNLLKIWCLENGMVINRQNKTYVNIKSPKRKYM